MTNGVTMNALVAKRAEILFEITEAEKRIEHSVPSWCISTPSCACSGPTSRPRGFRSGIADRPNRRTSPTAS
jgi:hypothetical protein